MNPELFTLVMRAEGAQPVMVVGAPQGEAVGYALGAKGVESIVILPTNVWDKEGDPDLTVVRSKRCIVCTPRPQGGLSASYLSTEDCHVPRWAETLINRLDTGRYEARRAEAQRKARHEVYGLEHRARVVA